MRATITAIIGHLAWPSLIAIFVILFRKEIRKAFNRIETAKLPGGTEFALTPDIAAPSNVNLSITEQLKKEIKSGK